MTLEVRTQTPYAAAPSRWSTNGVRVNVTLALMAKPAQFTATFRRMTAALLIAPGRCAWSLRPVIAPGGPRVHAAHPGGERAQPRAERPHPDERQLDAVAPPSIAVSQRPAIELLGARAALMTHVMVCQMSVDSRFDPATLARACRLRELALEPLFRLRQRQARCELREAHRIGHGDLLPAEARHLREAG